MNVHDRSPTSKPTPTRSSENGHRLAPPRSGIEAVDRVELPHASRIQAAFGRHVIGDVQAHRGPQASRHANMLGASAFASGSHVVFAGSPSLHTAAHEVAHVVQQRAGVAVEGGLGREGDAYERHADEVADGVVAGRSVESLLDRVPRRSVGASTSPVVQRKITATKEGVVFPDAEAAFAALTKSTSPKSLASACKGPQAPAILHYVRLLDASNMSYMDFRNFEAEVASILAKGQQKLVGPQPYFGTGFKGKSMEELVTIFEQALTVGYRAFDTAHDYDTLAAFQKALIKSGVPRHEVTLLYKLKPGEDAQANDVQAQLGKARTDLGGGSPDILMLHETHIDIETDKQALALLIARVKQGHALAVGVSNVDLGQLTALAVHAKSLGVPITHVENRFSPYHPDTEVRTYCQQQGIRYLAYGLAGSSMTAACGNQGEGMPDQYLLARSDPRLAALAKQANTSVDSLMIVWAQARGVVDVASSSNLVRAQQNFDATKLAIQPAILTAIDAVIAAPIAVKQIASRQHLSALYNSSRDSTAWWLLDELCKVPATMLLLDEIAGRIVQAQESLSEFAHRIVQCAADFQSYGKLVDEQKAELLRKQVDKKAELGAAKPKVAPVVEFDWLGTMIQHFASWASKRGNPRVMDLVFDWALQNPQLGRDVKLTESIMASVATGQYQPKLAKSATGKQNVGKVQLDEVFLLFASHRFESSLTDLPVDFDKLEVGKDYSTSLDGKPAEIRVELVDPAKTEVRVKMLRWIPIEKPKPVAPVNEKLLSAMGVMNFFKVPVAEMNQNHTGKLLRDRAGDVPWTVVSVDDMTKPPHLRMFKLVRVALL